VKLMKWKLFAAVTLTIVAVFIAALFVQSKFSELQNQINELQTQNSDLQNQISELQAQNSELQDQISELEDQKSGFQEKLRELLGIPVKITAFDWVEGFNPYVSLTFVNEVKVTVENYGIEEISGITLTVKLVNNVTLLSNSQPFVTRINALQAGESREISGKIYWAALSTTPTYCVSTLIFDDVVLDEWTYSF
jgi:FtsZ-binding cell division protein ZapB